MLGFREKMICFLFCLFVFVCPFQPLEAQPAESRSGELQDTVVYRLFTEQLTNHLLRVEVEFPAEAFMDSEVEVALPVWTPGSYKVRDYSRFLRPVSSLDGHGSVTKTAKNRWRVDHPAPRQAVRLSYSVYGREMTVRTNFFSPEVSLLNGAAVFLAPAPLDGEPGSQLKYRVEFPNELSPIYSGLARVDDRPYPVFVASTYDELLDCPFVFGTQTQAHSFSVGDRDHTLVQAGDWRFWNLEKSLKDLATLFRVQHEFWGEVPYDRYLIFNLLVEARGGLEHRNSTVVMASRWATEDRKSYLAWLGLISHEVFHTWNVKLLRPEGLGPFDYESEVYTPSLWVAEGVTSYYDDLLVRRAGLSTRSEYLQSLSKAINDVWSTPGRRSLSLTEASFDAWIRLYQETEDTLNSSVNYYYKGALVAWLLDAELRRRTDDRISLDQVLRHALARFGTRGFSEQEFRSLAQEVSGLDLQDFFSLALDSTEELELQPALDYWGLELNELGADDTYHGLRAELQSGCWIVTHVEQGSPAWNSGVSPGDELIAVADLRLSNHKEGLELFQKLNKGQSYSLLLNRRGGLVKTEIRFASPPMGQAELKVAKLNKTTERRLDSWLGPERVSD